MLLQGSDLFVPHIQYIGKDHGHQQKHSQQNNTKHIQTDLNGKKYIIVKNNRIIGKQTYFIAGTIVRKYHTGCHITVSIHLDHPVNHPVFLQTIQKPAGTG